MTEIMPVPRNSHITVLRPPSICGSFFYASARYCCGSVSYTHLVNLKGKSAWQRAEDLISVAHPDFREQLIADAEKMHIWKRSNKR